MAKISFDFQPGDHVWLMHDNKPVCGVIKKIWYSDFISPVDFEPVIGCVSYYIQVKSQDIGSHGRKELFTSKEDLIKSL